MGKLKCRNKDAYTSCEYVDRCHPVVCFKAADDVNELNYCCCCGSNNKMRRLKGAGDE